MNLELQMSKSIDNLRNSLIGIHQGNISVGLVSTVKVLCYGQYVPLQHVTSIIQSGNRISVSPYDANLLKSVEINLRQGGFNAAIFSKKEIIIQIPQMSGEQLQKTINHIKSLAEESKIAIRNIRKNFRTSLSEEDRKKMDKNIQQITDKSMQEIDNIVQSKITAM